jgi:hypothetical protein
MAEWLKAHAWKACVGNTTVGSNPTLSASSIFSTERQNKSGQSSSVLLINKDALHHNASGLRLFFALKPNSSKQKIKGVEKSTPLIED